MTEGLSPEPNRDGNLADWTRALEGVTPDLAERLQEDKIGSLDALEDIGLPHYVKKVVSLPDFLSNPTEHLEQVPSECYYITLVPRTKDLSRYAKTDLDSESVVAYVNEKIPEESRENYDIVLKQYFENLFGGSVVVNIDGAIYVECVKGETTDLNRGKVTPKYIAQTDQFTGSFRYNFENEDIRQSIQKALSAIPHKGEGRGAVYRTGYYQFLIVRRTKDAQPEPIFLDYKDDPAYLT